MTRAMSEREELNESGQQLNDEQVSRRAAWMQSLLNADSTAGEHGTLILSGICLAKVSAQRDKRAWKSRRRRQRAMA